MSRKRKLSDLKDAETPDCKRARKASWKEKTLENLKFETKYLGKGIKFSTDIWDLICDYTYFIIDLCEPGIYKEEYVTHVRTHGTLEVKKLRSFLHAPNLLQLECCEGRNEDGVALELNLSYLKSKLWHKLKISESVRALGFRRTNFNCSLELTKLTKLCFYEVDLDDWSKIVFPQSLQELHVLSSNFSASMDYLPNLQTISLMDYKNGTDWGKVRFPMSAKKIYLCRTNFSGTLENACNVETLCMYGVQRQRWDNIIWPKKLKILNLEQSNFNGDPTLIARKRRLDYMCTCKVETQRYGHCGLHWHWGATTGSMCPLWANILASKLPLHGEGCCVSRTTYKTFGRLFPMIQATPQVNASSEDPGGLFRD